MSQNRYSRQTLFAPIGENGQKQLANSRVLVVGGGALGTVLLNHLTRSGVGFLRIVDRDYVEMSNLQRQMLYDEDDVEHVMPKAIAAKQKLEKMNSDITIEALISHVSAENVLDLISDVDLVIDATDNLATRHLLNDACFKQYIPFSYGGVVSSRGMTAFFQPGETCCMRCMIAESSGTGETCDMVGVISTVVDVVASLQSTDALKYLTHNQDKIQPAVKTFDLWDNYNINIKFAEPNTDCPTCQQAIYPSLQTSEADEETVLCGRDTVQIRHHDSFDLTQWNDRLQHVATTQLTPFLLKAQFDSGMGFAIFPDGRVLVQGTEDIGQARTMYDRYIGS